MLIARTWKQLRDILARSTLMEKLARDLVVALRTRTFNSAWDKPGDNHSETCPLRVPRLLPPADA